jgi:hypothetical protein
MFELFVQMAKLWYKYEQNSFPFIIIERKTYKDIILLFLILISVNIEF